MPASQSQSTRVKPRNSQQCARSATRQGFVTPGQATCALIVARVPWSTLNLPGPRDGTVSGYLTTKIHAFPCRPCSFFPVLYAAAPGQTPT